MPLLLIVPCRKSVITTTHVLKFWYLSALSLCIFLLLLNHEETRGREMQVQMDPCTGRAKHKKILLQQSVVSIAFSGLHTSNRATFVQPSGSEKALASWYFTRNTSQYSYIHVNSMLQQLRFYYFKKDSHLHRAAIYIADRTATPDSSPMLVRRGLNVSKFNR